MADRSLQRSLDASLPAVEFPVEDWAEAEMGNVLWDYIVTGRIVRIEDGTVWVDVGSKIDSPLPLSEWGEGERPAVGDPVTVSIDDKRYADDRPLALTRVFVRKEPPRTDLWAEAIARYNLETIYRGRITRKIKNGFLIDIGVNTLLPESAATDEMRGDPQACLGREVNCRIARMDAEQRRFEVSLVP